MSNYPAPIRPMRGIRRPAERHVKSAGACSSGATRLAEVLREHEPQELPQPQCFRMLSCRARGLGVSALDTVAGGAGTVPIFGAPSGVTQAQDASRRAFRSVVHAQIGRSGRFGRLSAGTSVAASARGRVPLLAAIPP